MIRITYVTITFNAAKVLQRTLDSVLQQDYPNIVHLIIDGASTDDTLRLVDDYIARSNASENGHRIQVTSEPDKGIYDAMNKGLRSLDGDYVCFLNAGDFLPSPDTARKIAEAATNTHHQTPNTQLPAVLYGNTDIVDGEGRFLHHRRLSPPENLTWKSFRQGMIVPPGHAGMPPGILCPHRFRYRHTLRHAIPLLGRCRLVHTCYESCREGKHTTLELKNGCSQLYRGGTNNAPPPRIALGAI